MRVERDTEAGEGGGAGLTSTGAVLLLPLRALDQPAPMTLDLDRATAAPLSTWTAAVRGSADACLLLDAAGRVAAVSASARALLALPSAAEGACLVDLLAVVDFSAAGLPAPDAAKALPPLAALGTASLGRGLLRVRAAGGDLQTYDVVSVPLAGRSGSLSFLAAV